jgi:two-component system LytT family sensor kinase
MAFGFWSIIGLSFAIQLYLTRSEIGLPVTWRYAIGRNLIDWYVFALLSMPALWLARRIPIERADWGRRVTIHAAASAMFSLGWMALRSLVVGALQLTEGGREMSFTEAFTHALVATFFFNVAVYWVVAGYGHTVNYYRKFQERELRASELETRLAHARLQALQMQLNPHFLFNTLHAISSLMHKNVEAADRMLTRLSDLLRHALEGTDTQVVPLREELDFLRRYLEIEQTRFGPRLTVRYDIAPDTLDAEVPNLVLQPLVENAIRHGIEPLSSAGQIELYARREAGMLRLQVLDNGKGLPPGALLDEGVGLANTRARLQQLYGIAHRIEAGNRPEGGFAVRIAIPWRGAAAAELKKSG